jgi:CIC family chloride channel protein
VRFLTKARSQRRNAFREAFPLGSTNQVIAVDEDGRYAGMVIVAEANCQADNCRRSCGV